MINMEDQQIAHLWQLIQALTRRVAELEELTKHLRPA